MPEQTGGRRLRTYLIGATVSRTGDEMSGLALLLLALAASDALSTGPAVVAALAAATAVGGPILGVLLDRARHPGRLLALMLLGFATIVAVVALLLGRVQVSVLVGVALVGGLFRPALSGGWSARLPDVVPARELARTSALDGLTFDIAALAAPVLVGILAVGLSPAYAVAAAVLALLLALPAARSTDSRPTRGRPPVGRPPLGLRRQVLTGFRAIARIGPLRRATITSVISYVGVGLIFTSVPLLTQRVLGRVEYGPWLLALMALAALIGNAAYAARPDRFTPDRVLVVTFCLIAVASGLAALALVFGRTPVGISCLLSAAVIAGTADGPQLSALLRIRHRDAPEGVRGQVFTTGASLKLGGAATGAALCGALASDLPGAMLVAAGAELAALGCFIALSRRRTTPDDGVAGVRAVRER